MKYLFTLLFSLMVFTILSQSIKFDKDIIGGRMDSIYSNILKEKRPILIYVPTEYDSIIFAPERYPVVYLLDGNTHFFSVMSMILHMSELSGNNLCPKMILVGIPNTNDRTHDLTPTHTNIGFDNDSNSVRTSGGGEKFTEFIQKELFPYIESKYPTAPYRTLIGHSYGGIFAVNTLIHHTEMFNSYVVIDPSMWWDGRKLLEQAKIAFQQKKFNNISLYLGQANTMQGADTTTLKNELPRTINHMRACFVFAEALKLNNNNGLRWKYKYYNEDTHSSVPFITEYDAFRFIFDFHKCSFLKKMSDVNFKGDSAIVAHYKNISKKMGYTVYPPEGLINTVGCDFVLSKQLDKAFPFLKMNVENYPTSFNTWDSFAWWYEEKGDKEKAIEYYNKTLKLRDWPDTRKRLKGVLEKK